MKVAFTDRWLRSLSYAKLKKLIEEERKTALPDGARLPIVWDATLPSFGIRASSAQVSFLVKRRRAGASAGEQPVTDILSKFKFKFGAYPKQGGPLANARKAAQASIVLLQEGVVPKQRRKAMARAAERERQHSFEAVTEVFIKRHVSKLRSAWNMEQTIRRELLPRWADRPIAGGIERREVVAMLEKVVESGRPGIARHLLAYGKKIYNWAIARDLYGIETSPFDRVVASEIIGELAKRDRILADTELRAIWNETDRLGYPFGPFVKLLILTGQRLREVADMSWSEVDLAKALWTVPAARMKGLLAHEVPLVPRVVEILKSLPRFQDGDFVFSTTGGRRPVSGFSKTKARLEAMALEALRIEKTKPQGKWTYHDLRRTMRTHLGGLPIPSDVAEMVIGHRQSGVRAVYDLHRYRDEKRRALDLWAARLKEIVEATANGKVVQLQRA
jgi:integrase